MHKECTSVFPHGVRSSGLAFTALEGLKLELSKGSQGFPGGARGICVTMHEMLEMQVWSLGWEDSPVGRNGSLHQYSCLENLMDREAWWTTIHGVAKSWTWLNIWAQRQPCCAWHKWVLFWVSDKICYFSWLFSLVPTWGNFRVARLGFLDQDKIQFLLKRAKKIWSAAG